VQDFKGLLLGELAVHHGHLTEEQLDACLQKQIDERYARPLGEVMLSMELIERTALEALLMVQRSSLEAFENAAQHGGLFGKSALVKGFVTQEQLSQAVRAQARSHARGAKAKLGQVMMDLGLITINQFWDILREQGDFLCGTCRQKIVAPWFRGATVMCENCKTPAFTVSSESGGPAPRKRRRRKD
jgi:hypothetical protein